MAEPGFFLASSPLLVAEHRVLLQHGPLDRFVKLHRRILDVVLRELISQLQARAQRIDEAPMPRFRQSVDFHQKYSCCRPLVSLFMAPSMVAPNTDNVSPWPCYPTGLCGGKERYASIRR